MSIESRLYNMFYDGFERLDSKVIELTEAGRNEEIPDLERPLKKADKLFSAIKYATGAFALYQGADVLHDVIVNNGADHAIYLKSTLAVASGFLSVHFHYATKLGKTLKEKIFRKNASEEKSTINRWRKIGRYSHFGGILSVGAAIAPAVYTVANNSPILGGVLIGVGGYCVYHNWIQGYNALYKSETDFINGERRFKPEPTPSKN